MAAAIAALRASVLKPAPEISIGGPHKLREGVYAAADAGRKFVDDFAAAWTKMMNANRFDLARP
ncbi:hypothetical protein JMJ55_29265 [Belnapia sp. T6]|uniref:Uncharacterized protein n=1 Tax=Belnapia mucosa TaxID=2804532 RepID=A0ABS1VCL0_9PROT|nr:hypothetical protein [Belnapia mucosa]MBL6459408.1 hypothetical protein [Belnapia mucosa]